MINEVPGFVYHKTFKWNRIIVRHPDYKIHYSIGYTIASSAKPRGKKPLQHHRKIVISIFLWGREGICLLYKVGTFYSNFTKTMCLLLSFANAIEGYVQIFTIILLHLLLYPNLTSFSFKHFTSSQRRGMLCSWQSTISAAYCQFLHIYIRII